MVKPAVRKGARKKVLRRSRHRLLRIYTTWHPFQLSREPLRIDVVVVRRSRPGTPPAPRLLASVLDALAEHTLVHFKGPTGELERDDARMLLAYALHYLVVAELEDPALVALRVVAPRLTPRFVAALGSLGCELGRVAAGIHEGRLGVFPLRVIETVPVNARAGEHLLYTVTPAMLADPGGIPPLTVEEIEVFWALHEHVEQLRHPLPGLKRRHMKDENKVVESIEQALTRLLARLPPERRLAGLGLEERLAGLEPEQRLAGLEPEQVLGRYAPEQRLAGLTEAQAVLALPDAMLRGLSNAYLATLPPETRAAIEMRLGAKAPSHR